MSTVLLGFVAAVALPCAAIGDGLPRNWPMPPKEIEHHLANEQFRILEVKGAGGGVTGASRLKIELPGSVVMKVKWKAVPDKKLDGWNNSPRKELAAYEVQRLFLDENDFVVPTSVPYCIALTSYGPIRAKALASVPNSKCVLGILSVWMTDVDAPAKFFNRERFDTNAVYARSMADMNLLGYLIEHKDGRQGNLLVSTDENDTRVYAVDNGISFDPFPWNFLVMNWNKIRVPWLNRASVDRLRKVQRSDLDRFGVLVELATDNDGVFHVVPAGANMNPKKGARIGTSHVQFGLTRHEIDDLDERLHDLLQDVDRGRIKVH